MKGLPVHQIDAAGYVGDGSKALHDDGTWKEPSGGTTGLVAGPVDLQYDTIDIDAYTGQSDAAVRLDIPSHVAGDENTHPSVLYFPEKWHGYHYWMGFSPLLDHNNATEDPCVAVSQDGTQWETPPGFTNPLDDAPGSASGNYNSDPELVISPDGTTLSLIWRNRTTTETLYMRSTTDGVTWTAKQAILAPAGGDGVAASPAVLHDGTQWVMWAVDITTNPNQLVRRTASALTGPWSALTTCTVTGLPAGRDLWHLSVVKLGSQYIGLLNDCTAGVSGEDGELYLMRSTDGLAWTLGEQTVFDQALAGNYDAVYRGSLVPTFENGRLEFDVWHGAYLATSPWTWGIYRRRLSQAVSGPSSTGITVQDEGAEVATGVTTLDFQGAGVSAAAGLTGEVVVTVSSISSGGSSGELLMQDGVTSPPVPLETEAGDDWLYEG